MKNVGKPCEGEPHARIDGGRLETEASATVTGVAPPGGKPREERPRDLPPPTPPRQPPTLLRHGNSARQFLAIDGYAHERMAIFTSAKHNRPGRNWTTRYPYAWYRRLGVHRLSGTIQWTTTHA